jgi:small subunit ribosomal protein S4e
MVLNSRGKLSMVDIADKEAGIKIVRVRSKTSLKGKKLQVGLSDGRSVLLGKHDLNVGDSMLLAVPKQAIEGTLKLGVGATVLFTAGSYAGGFGTVVSIKSGMLTFNDGSGEHETRASYAFVVGEKGKTAVKMV